MVSARVAYSAPDRSLTASVWNGRECVDLGPPVTLRKSFSAAELKLDAQAEGLEVDILFSNCRLFPQPERAPVTVFVGAGRELPLPVRRAVVELLGAGTGECLARGTTDDDGLAELWLVPSGLFPVAGRMRIVGSDGASCAVTLDGVGAGRP